MNNFNRTNEVCVDKIAYRDQKKLELVNDYILPDYIADIKTILYIKPVIHRSNHIISDSKVEYDGDVTYYAAFITEDNKIQSTVFEDSFNGSVSIEGINDNHCMAMISPRINELTHKLNNPRKLNIKSIIDMNISILCRHCISPRMTGKHALEDEMTLERREIDIPFTKYIQTGENEITVSEDIVLDSSYPSIDKLLFCTLDPYISDMRVSNGKLLYRGEILVSCLYAASEEALERYYTINKKIPIEGELELENDIQKENCTWKITASRPKTEVRSNEFDEKRIIELDFSYDFQVICSMEDHVQGVTDAYSIDCDYTNVFNSFNILNKAYRTVGNISINESIPLLEIGDDHTGEILTSSSAIQNISTTFDAKKGKVLCSGEIVFDLCVKKENDNPQLIQFARPFKFETDGSGYHDSMYFSADAAVISLKTRYDDNNYYTDAEIGYTISAEDIKNISVIESIDLNKNDQHPAQGGTYPITLYYPQMNESLWDIAKKYNTTSNAIKSANDLIDDDITNIRVLIIPRGAVKPIYAKLI